MATTIDVTVVCKHASNKFFRTNKRGYVSENWVVWTTIDGLEYTFAVRDIVYFTEQVTS